MVQLARLSCLTGFSSTLGGASRHAVSASPFATRLARQDWTAVAARCQLLSVMRCPRDGARSAVRSFDQGRARSMHVIHVTWCNGSWWIPKACPAGRVAGGGMVTRCWLVARSLLALTVGASIWSFFASHAFDMEFLPSGPHRGRSFDWTVSVPFNMNARFDQTVSTYPDIR